MASLFTEGWIGEHGNNAVRAGLRVYFGQHDKSLIDHHRQDDPTVVEALLASALLARVRSLQSGRVLWSTSTQSINKRGLFLINRAYRDLILLQFLLRLGASWLTGGGNSSCARR